MVVCAAGCSSPARLNVKFGAVLANSGSGGDRVDGRGSGCGHCALVDISAGGRLERADPALSIGV
jgi:hypothetical protein